MLISVKLFGQEAIAAGQREVAVDIEEGSTCEAVASALAERAPALAPSIPTARFAINCEFAAAGDRVHEGDEVALIGAVSGG